MSTDTTKNGQPDSVKPDSGEVPPIWSLDAMAAEIATYKARLPEMAREHEGEYVLIKGTEVVGFFPDDPSAMREGRRRFGFVPFVVKQIRAQERVVYIPNVVL
jgi:hypothetical protein